MIAKDVDFEFELTREKFVEICSRLFELCMPVVEGLLQDTGYQAE